MRASAVYSWFCGKGGREGCASGEKGPEGAPPWVGFGAVRQEGRRERTAFRLGPFDRRGRTPQGTRAGGLGRDA